MGFRKIVLQQHCNNKKLRIILLIISILASYLLFGFRICSIIDSKFKLCELFLGAILTLFWIYLYISGGFKKIIDFPLPQKQAIVSNIITLLLIICYTIFLIISTEFLYRENLLGVPLSLFLTGVLLLCLLAIPIISITIKWFFVRLVSGVDLNHDKTKSKKIFFGIFSFISILFVYVIIGWDLVSTVFLWAEDGNIFLQGAIDNGWSSLFAVYAGYFHILPRLVTLIAFSIGSPFNNLILIATIMKWTTIILSVYFIWFFTTNKFEWLIKNKWIRLLIVVCIPFIATCTPEIYCNITNIQWWGGIFIFLIGLNMIRGEMPSILNAVLLTLLVLSTPFCPIILILILIFILNRWHQIPGRKICQIGKSLSKRDIIICLTLCLVTVLHLLIVINCAESRISFDFFSDSISSMIMLCANSCLGIGSSIYMFISGTGILNEMSLPFISLSIQNYVIGGVLGIIVLIFISTVLILKKKVNLLIYFLVFEAIYLGLAFYVAGNIGYNRYSFVPGIVAWLMLCVSTYCLLENTPNKWMKTIVIVGAMALIIYAIFVYGGLPLFESYGYLIESINPYVNFSSLTYEWVGIAPQWSQTHWGINLPVNPH